VANTLQGLPACEREGLIAPELTLPLAASKMPAKGQKQPLPPEAMASLQKAPTWTGWMTQAERHLVWSRGAWVP
jgi:hypothetical protein